MTLLTDPVEILDGTAELVRMERLIQGAYVTSSKDDGPKGGTCEGRYFCLLGSLWWAAGVRPDPDSVSHDRARPLPGAASWERVSFLRDKPALKRAYDALNEAALHFADEKGINLREDASSTGSVAEELFEHHAAISDYDRHFEIWYAPPGPLTRDDLLEVIARAKRLAAA